MRRRRTAADRLALLEEMQGVLSVTEYGAALEAAHVPATYARLCELAEALEMPPPPSVEVLAELGAGERWALEAGLLHPAGGCRDRDEHWAFWCC